MRVCVCNNLTVDEIRDTVNFTGAGSAEEIFRILRKRFVCGNCRSLISSVAELSAKQSKRKT